MDFIFDPSLVLYLPLWKLDGSSFMSKDACGHLCTVTGALWRPNGRYFEGADDKITVPNHASLNPTQGITLEVWVKNSSTPNYSILNRDDVATRVWALRAGGTKTEFRLWNSGDTHVVVSGSSISVGVWHHLVGTYDKNAGSDNQKVYIDGGLDKTGTHAGDIKTGTLDIRLGEGATTDFSGVMGEVRIYNRALTPVEIQNIYLATKWRYR